MLQNTGSQSKIISSNTLQMLLEWRLSFIGRVKPESREEKSYVAEEMGHWVCGRGTLRSKHCHSCLQNPGAEEILLALPKRRLIELNPQFIYKEVLTNLPRILLKSREHYSKDKAANIRAAWLLNKN